MSNLFGISGGKEDPRCQPLALITNGTVLYEVVKQLAGCIEVADCSGPCGHELRSKITFSAIQGIGIASAKAPWKLVRAAPVLGP